MQYGFGRHTLIFRLCSLTWFSDDNQAFQSARKWFVSSFTCLCIYRDQLSNYHTPRSREPTDGSLPFKTIADQFVAGPMLYVALSSLGSFSLIKLSLIVGHIVAEHSLGIIPHYHPPGHTTGIERAGPCSYNPSVLKQPTGSHVYYYSFIFPFLRRNIKVLVVKWDPPPDDVTIWV